MLIVGELMKQAERHLLDGVHPRLMCEGIHLAKLRTPRRATQPTQRSAWRRRNATHGAPRLGTRRTYVLWPSVRQG